MNDVHTMGALCAGVGGLEMGLGWALGAKTIWQVEIEPHLRAVLAATWPDAERFDDVEASGGHFVWRNVLRPVDLICFGSPCQDVSPAGKRLGLNGPKSRLFYECARIVGELSPEWVVFENVAGGASRWVDAVRQELEQLGYATLPDPLGASDCGAPHPRARVFIIAHAHRVGIRQQSGGGSRENRGNEILARVAGKTLPPPRITNPHREPFDLPAETRSDVSDSSGDCAEPLCDCGHAGNDHGDGWGVAVEWCGECSCTRFSPRIAADPDGELGNARRSGARQESSGGTELAGIATTDALQSRREGPGPGAYEVGGRPAADGWRPPIPGILRMVHGLSGGAHAADSKVARRARRLEASAARKRIAALGNACTPQQAEVVGHVIRLLIEAERLRTA